MFNRFARLIRSFFNKFLTAAEDPILILENNIREMRDSIPKLNQALAKAQGSVILLQKELEVYGQEEAALRAKLKAAAMANEDKLGQDMALQLQRVLNAIQKQEAALKTAKEGLQSMKEMRDAQIRKIQQETEKVKGAIKDARVAKLQGELASLFETFDVGDVAYSNEEMLQKLREESATNEGKLQVAADGYDMKALKLDQQAEELQAQSLYEQFKHEMGISAGSDTDAKKEKKAQKTIG